MKAKRGCKGREKKREKRKGKRKSQVQTILRIRKILTTKTGDFSIYVRPANALFSNLESLPFYIPNSHNCASHWKFYSQTASPTAILLQVLQPSCCKSYSHPDASPKVTLLQVPQPPCCKSYSKCNASPTATPQKTK